MLQLHKWDPSETQIRLLDFCKAFLYPTREILLLYSYEREALLLPLSKEDDVPSKAAKVDSIKSACRRNGATSHGYMLSSSVPSITPVLSTNVLLVAHLSANSLVTSSYKAIGVPGGAASNSHSYASSPNTGGP
ncbi:Zinc finger protein [Spatholobus suberectus]|nr:Zinc finger protein [Spatholobus suberectus]